LLRIAAARIPSQAKAGFRVLRLALRVYRFRNHSPALPIEDNDAKSSGTCGKLMEVSFLIRLAS
jgi:hypothetical protein